ncbi:uncharacterized protein [Diadema antillarum]|uniref:uncharacterized protein n=1 Tax=Diadema antillarum TaxID=105358 RepID=UPI003A8BCB1A
MYEDMKTRYEDLKHRQLQGCSLPGSGNHRNRAVVVTTSPLLGVPDHGVQGAGDRINSLPTSLPSIQQKSSEALQLVEVDHAYDLADRVSVPQFRHVLRKLHVSDTDIANLDMNRSDAKEFFVQGIQLWKSEAGGKANVQALIKALLDLKLCLQAQEFCNHFGFVCPQEEKDERPSQISVSQDSIDGVADSPAVLTPAYIPKSKLDTILHPFLLDPSGFDDLNQGLSNQSSFDEEEVEKFAKLSNIKSCDYDLFKSVISVGGETVGPDVMLEAWAEVEVQKTPLSRSREQSVHSLGKVLRELQRRDIRHILVSHLESGLLGPWLDNKVFFRDKRVPYSFARDLGHLLSSSTIGQADWRIFASDVGFSEHIKQFERRQTPGMEVLDAWKTRKESTIGYLYSWAKEKDRMDIVKMLEEGVKN